METFLWKVLLAKAPLLILHVRYHNVKTDTLLTKNILSTTKRSLSPISIDLEPVLTLSKFYQRTWHPQRPKTHS